ncbi:serine hydrolase domain-containing protein [Macrococcus capreoli]|uniref:serine hydrolase domain-containing protein n=1 Tax=Macrococcus capreoli TaxID=2982690 RepID=UPI0021D5EE07|nr:serine hydrolase domain-containing protein [Macrococcus sp. TMW 2.2395]MCU7556363.1 beta-lactamase family protein [Macrococcus sp. TMW 2.2395]
MKLNTVMRYIATCMYHGVPVKFEHYFKRVKTTQMRSLSAIQPMINDETFSGSIWIRHQQQYSQYNVGYLSQSDRRLITDDSLYLTGSIQKFLTGIRIAQLESEGILNRTDAVKRYFPDINSDKVTLEDLLLHRSGMKAYHPGNLSTYETCIAYILEDSFQADKFGQYEYNDANYILLSKIIEIVTEYSYKENIYQHILRPLKMYQSYFYDEAKGYTVGGMSKVKHTLCATYEEPLVQYYGAGNMYMTLHDIDRLCQAFVNNEVLDADTKQSLIEPSKRYVQDYRFGFGVKKGYFRIRGVLNGVDVTAWFNKEQTIIVASHLILEEDPKRCEHLVEQLYINKQQRK